MKITIVTDSASDITQDEALRLGIKVAPLTTVFGDEEFLDGVNLSKEEFYNKLIESDVIPSTSQVPPARFEEYFSESLEESDALLCITISSKLSGTYQSACIAATEFDGKVAVVDSKNVSLGQKALVARAIDILKEKPSISLTELKETIEKEKKDLVVVALLDTLEYLKKGGRISAAKAAIAGTLSIKPVIALEDGEIKLLGKARGSKNGNNLLSETAKKKGDIDYKRPICLAYSGLTDELLTKYYQDNKHLYQLENIQIEYTQIGSTIGTHAGPGAIGVAFFAKI